MDIFPLVLAGHLLGDFIAQTDWQAANKEISWKADLEHAGTYTATMAVCVLPAWHTPLAVLFLGITFASHALLDRRWPTRAIMKATHSAGFSTLLWGVISNDQALHISLLAIMTYLMAGH